VHRLGSKENSTVKWPLQHAQENASSVLHSLQIPSLILTQECQGHEQGGDFSGWIYPSTVLGMHSMNKVKSLESTVFITFCHHSSKLWTVQNLKSQCWAFLQKAASWLPVTLGAHEVNSLQPDVDQARVFPLYCVCQRKYKKLVGFKNLLGKIRSDPSFRFSKDFKSKSCSSLGSETHHLLHFLWNSHGCLFLQQSDG
jgi:hypothetical protein